jgi:ribosome-associated protein
MEKIKITSEYIKLDQFLKWANVVGSGVDAKFLIKDGFVKVNGEVEVRRGRKLYPGDKVVFDNKEEFEVI